MQFLNKLKELNRKATMPVKAAVAAVFVILLLTMLPAAIPDSEVPESDVSIPFDDKLPEMDQTAKPNDFPHIVIVYPAGDAWGQEEAEHVKALLSSRFHAHFVVISDSDYLALDAGTLELYNAEPSLTLTLGITALLEDSYLEVLSRLGGEGMQIAQNKNRIDIISASPARINEGARAFADAIGYDNGLVIDESLFICDERPDTDSGFTPDLVSDGEFKLLTFSYIDSNPYTLRAIEGIIAAAKPDLVVFNGYVDGGAETRRELADLWQSISDILKKTYTPWCFTPGALTGSLPLITVCEVISSFPGCIRIVDGAAPTGFTLTVGAPDGSVAASIYVGDINGSEALADRIEADRLLYERAGETEREIIPILPALCPQMMQGTSSLPADKVAQTLSPLYDALKKSGADTFICAASSVSPAVVKYEGGSLYLCGSVGFDSLGIGGRFDYNHSLRCGVLLTLGEGSPSCIYAADLGLNER